MLALGIAALLVVEMGCANSPNSKDGYYRRGRTQHADSFPPGYSPGRGRYGRY